MSTQYIAALHVTPDKRAHALRVGKSAEAHGVLGPLRLQSHLICRADTGAAEAISPLQVHAVSAVAVGRQGQCLARSQCNGSSPKRCRGAR